MRQLARDLSALLNALGWLGRWLVGRLLEVLAPPRCVACDVRLPHRAVFCPPCAQTVELLGAPSDSIALLTRGSTHRIRLVACGAYGGALAEAIHRFKYRNRPELALPLGELARRAAVGLGAPVDVVVPIPLHFARLAQRGYNQSALLARIVARQLGATFGPVVLGRTRPSRPQVSLRGAERRRNLSGAFVVRRAHTIRNRSVLLVDDVCTTGTTIAECASALLAAGARTVSSLVLARATDDARLARCESRSNHPSVRRSPRSTRVSPESDGRGRRSVVDPRREAAPTGTRATRPSPSSTG